MPPKKKVKTSHDAFNDTQPKTAKGKAKGGKTARRNVRGKRGGLESMPHMPLDVLIEIFGFLEPQDLLSLARTTKDFRAFLMSREASSFWEKSRLQMTGLPKRPEHLSEPAFANLLFSNHCHNCLKTGTTLTPYWKAYVRYCATCKDEMFLDLPDESVAWKAAKVVESSPWEFITEVHVQLRGSRRSDTRFHRPDLERFEKTWLALRTKPKRQKFFEECRDFVKSSTEHAKELERWEEHLQREAAAQIEARRQERFEAVLDRLREEDWGEEVDKMSQHDLNRLFDLNLVGRAVKLTDKGWSAARPMVMQFMEKTRAVRQRNEYIGTILSRLRCLRDVLHEHQLARWREDPEKAWVYVGVVTCAFIPEVRAIIEDMSEGVTAESVSTKFTQILPDLTTRWVEDRRKEYLEVLLKSFADSDAAKAPEPLELAVALFNCRLCSYRTHTVDERRWPRIVEHHCFMGHLNPADDDFSSCVKSVVGQARPDYQHFGDKFVQADRGLAHIRDVIKACGQDPDVVTYREMEQCTVRLRCIHCATLAKQEIFDWKAAIHHDAETHYANRSTETLLPGRWQPIPQENAQTAIKLATALMAKPINFTDWRASSYMLHCTKCGETGSHIEMQRHLQRHHHKENAELDKDFYILHRDPPRIWMYSHILASHAKVQAAVEAGEAFLTDL